MKTEPSATDQGHTITKKGGFKHNFRAGIYLMPQQNLVAHFKPIVHFLVIFKSRTRQTDPVCLKNFLEETFKPIFSLCRHLNQNVAMSGRFP